MKCGMWDVDCNGIVCGYQFTLPCCTIRVHFVSNGIDSATFEGMLRSACVMGKDGNCERGMSVRCGAYSELRKEFQDFSLRWHLHLFD